MKRVALYHLETLVWIARLGTFGAAAERLNTTQPTVSARVRELEGQIGVRLFNRQGRTMALTVRGRELVRECETLWFSIEKALLAQNEYAGASGIVRIGSGEIAAARCLPAFAAEIKSAMPGISLELEIDLTTNLLHDLLNAKTDIVFAIGPIIVPGLRTASLGYVELVWLANPRVQEKLAKRKHQSFDDLPLWALARNSPLHQTMVDAFRDQPVPHRPVNTCNNVRTLIEIVAAGGGIGLFPTAMVQDQVASGVLVAVSRRSPPPILIQTAMRSTERDPLIAEIFQRAARIEI